MATGSWLVGSYENLPAQTWSVTANSVTEDVTIPAGDYYLDDSTNSRSLVLAVATAMNTHSELSDIVCLLAPNRHVFMNSPGATNFAVTFTDTVASLMLGYTANLASDRTHNAPQISDYLWVPDKPESPNEAILGVEGYRVKDTRAGLSGLGGRVVVTHNDTRVYNEFFWDCLEAARFWTDDELGGEYQSFWDTVVSTGLRFKLYRNTTETTDTDSDVGLLGSAQLGPYKFRFASGGRVAFDVQRKQALADANFRVSLPVIVVADYTSS